FSCPFSFLYFLLFHRLLLFSFLRIPRPPISTLFPYTTLFRSLLPESARCRFRTADIAAPVPHPAGRPGSSPGAPTLRRRRRGPADRKSTRLNSSHVEISYAVFCLKKKKQKKCDKQSN